MENKKENKKMAILLVGLHCTIGHKGSLYGKTIDIDFFISTNQ